MVAQMDALSAERLVELKALMMADKRVALSAF